VFTTTNRRSPGELAKMLGRIEKAINPSLPQLSMSEEGNSVFERVK